MIIHMVLPPRQTVCLGWVVEFVFREIFGLPFHVTEGEQAEIAISADGRKLVMPSLFPDIDAERTAYARQMPSLPLAEFDATRVLPEAGLEAPLPVLFGCPKIEMPGDEIRCGMDILGTIFFMLSRFEEIALADRDSRDRFPATASLAWKAGFLYRPIVDEYIELLWVMMKRLWPGLTRKRRQGQVRVSCDVDQPFDRVGRNPITLLRVLRHELLVRPRPRIAALRTANFIAAPFGSSRFDPFHAFDWYMDVCERHGRQAAFYFIADHSAGAIDGTYSIDEPRILGLLRRLAGRGHEIGMHGSYNTYRDGTQIRKERSRLSAACASAGIDADVEGNRQHYLRWSAAETPDHLDEAGFGYDTSGSFADRPGFRYGTSCPFLMWSWKDKAPLRLRQRPLVVMEVSVLSTDYLGLGHSEEAMDLMQTLKRRAMRHGGDFTLLWHNSEFFTPNDREFFEILVE